MGKTSFVKYIANKVEQDFHMLPIYLNNDGRDEIDDLIQNIIEATFKVLDKNSKGQKLIEKFVGHINEIKFTGVGISLKNKPEIVQNVKNNFQEFLLTIANSLDDVNGLFIVIDDINGLSYTPDFPNWYKSLSETIDFSENFVPIAFTLVSYKENFDKLTIHNPSFSRIFHLINIDYLEDHDIERFFIGNFNKYNIKFKDDLSLNQMVYYSWGMPLTMQQLVKNVLERQR